MKLWSRFRSLIRRFGRGDAWERSLDSELQAYLEHDIDAKVEAGMSRAEARRAALVELGGAEQIKEEVRSSAVGAWLDGLAQDLRYAFRAFRHSRSYIVWVLASLTIGMAAVIAGFTLLNSMWFRPYPGVADQHRLVKVDLLRNPLIRGREAWNYAGKPDDYDALRSELTALDDLAGYSRGNGEVAVALPAARSIAVFFTSPNYFDVLGVRPILGRFFEPDDEDMQAAVAVISHTTWTRDFDANPSAIGRSVQVASQFVNIIGVVPDGFVGTDQPTPARRLAPDMWLPIWVMDRVPSITDAGVVDAQEPSMHFVGRLRDESEVQQVQIQADVVAQRRTDVDSNPWKADVHGVWRFDPRRWQRVIGAVMPVPFLVLAIACLNAANLMLARWSQRRREMAVRLAMGAGRFRIVRQLLIESTLVTFVATAMALPLAWAWLRLADGFLGIPPFIDVWVVALAVLTAAGTTIAFGLGPALRVSTQPPSTVLGSVSSRSDVAPKQSSKRRLLVVAQAALSLGLLSSGQQFVHTVQSEGAAAGVASDRLLMAQFNLARLQRDAAETERFYDNLLREAALLPGVEAAGLARNTAVWTFGRGVALASLVYWLPGSDPADGEVVTGGYAAGELFRALGLNVISGRQFVQTDRSVRPRTVIVNQAFAEMLSAPAVGQTIRVATRHQVTRETGVPIEVQVVGVVESAEEPGRNPDAGKPLPKLYLPSPLVPEPALALYLRTSDKATTLGDPVRRLVNQLDAGIPIQRMGSLESFNEDSYGDYLWLARAAAFLGIIGLLLAAAGLYGVSSYLAAMRSREVAIRLAIGARPQAILKMMIRQSMTVVLAGLFIGGGLSILVSRLVQANFHGIAGFNYVALAVSAALFIAAMLLATSVPALRVSRLNPIENLKAD